MRLTDFLALTEARRNADHPAQQRDRIPGQGRKALDDLLRPYADDPNVYISFTDLPRAGLKPTSYYDTPIGVYGYPIAQYISEPNEDPEDAKGAPQIDQMVPFAGDRPYIVVLQSLGNILHVMNYTQKDFDRDTKKLYHLYGERYLKMEQEALKDLKGWDGAEHAPEAARKIWAVLRRIAQDRNIEDDPIVSGRPTVRWSKLLLRLGYKGVSDADGTGLIHKNEPFQAFFITPDSYKVLEIIDTKKGKDLQHKMFKTEPPLDRNSAKLRNQANKMRHLAQTAPDKFVEYLRNKPTAMSAIDSPLNYNTLKLILTDSSLDGVLLNEIVSNITAKGQPRAETVLKLYDDIGEDIYALRRLPYELMGKVSRGVEMRMIWRKRVKAPNHIPDDIANHIISKDPTQIGQMAADEFSDMFSQKALYTATLAVYRMNKEAGLAMGRNIQMNMLSENDGPFSRLLVTIDPKIIGTMYFPVSVHRYAFRKNPMAYYKALSRVSKKWPAELHQEVDQWIASLPPDTDL